MSERSRPRTLPLRRWLVLALAVLFIVPVLSTGAAIAHLLGGRPGNQDMAAEVLRDGAPRWDDPAWQAETQEDLASRDVDFVLFVDGQEIYRSSPNPLSEADIDGSPALAYELVIEGEGPRQVAHIYAESIPAGEQFWPVPVVGVVALLLTITAIGWFLGSTVVRPLAATSRAARQVAAGDLDVELPSSRVREVAEVNEAFEGMSAELGASLDQRAALEQERRLLISSVAHDLRTPLFSLRGHLEGLEKGIADTPERRARYIAVAQEKADALERLIADLFTYTRLEYLDQAPNREPLDVCDLLRRLVDGMRPQVEAKDLDVTLELPGEPCIVDGDAHMLTRALENLLDNALRYSPTGGSVGIACRGEPGDARITIADSGPGIPESDLPHLFSPLYRGESSRSRRTGGAGLGLSIARRILRSHGGDLTAANAGSGGAVFTATLPRTAPDRSTSDEGDRAASTPVSGGDSSAGT